MKQVEELKKIEFGDDICLLFDNVNNYRYIACKYIIDGLKKNEKVFSVIDEYPKDLLIEDLEKENIDVDYFIEVGQLVISSNKDIYYGNDGFDVDEVINNWKEQLLIIEKENFSGFRALGEMLFPLDGKADTLDKLMEYEFRVHHEALRIYDKQINLCVFNKSKFPNFILQDMIEKHKVIIHNKTVIKPNPYYVDFNSQLEKYLRKVEITKQFSLDSDNYDKNIKNEKIEEIDIGIMDNVHSATGDGIWKLDLRTLEIDFSKTIYNILGYSFNQIIHHYDEFVELIHPEDVEKFNYSIDNCCRNKALYFDCEIRVKKRNIQWTWLYLKGIPIQKNTNNEKILKLAGIFTDINYIKQTENELKENKEILKESKEIYKILFEYMPYGCMLLSEKKIIYANQALANIAKVKDRESLIERPFTDFFISHPDDEKIANERKMLLYNKKRSLELIESKLLLHDGAVLEVESAGMPFKVSGKDHILSVIRDLTTHKEYERNLKIAKEKAEEANKLKSKFIAKISHELRTPMNGILGATELLRDAKLDKTHQEYLEWLSMSTNRLYTLIERIIDLTRIEAGKVEIKKTKFNLATLSQNAINHFKMEANKKDIELMYFIDENIPKTLVGGSKEIEQIIYNLLGNAIKFTDSGKITLDIKIKNKKDNSIELEISIIDTGIGIPNDKIDSLFLSFNQVQEKQNRNNNGIGLGLYITKELIKLMGGSIQVQSKEGIGSRFYFTIELEISDLSEKQPNIKLKNNLFNPKEYCILLAEDDLINQKLTKYILEKNGFSLEIASTGKEVLILLDSKHFHIILMDINMPEMDGMEVTQIIRNNNNNIPIIALTAAAMKEDQEKCLELGMNDYISKPVKSDNLYEKIEKLLIK